MEIKIAREGEWRPMALGGSAGVSGDILVGRDAEITWEDVYTGMSFFLFPSLFFGGPCGSFRRVCLEMKDLLMKGYRE